MPSASAGSRLAPAAYRPAATLRGAPCAAGMQPRPFVPLNLQAHPGFLNRRPRAYTFALSCNSAPQPCSHQPVVSPHSPLRAHGRAAGWCGSGSVGTLVVGWAESRNGVVLIAAARCCSWLGLGRPLLTPPWPPALGLMGSRAATAGVPRKSHRSTGGGVRRVASPEPHEGLQGRVTTLGVLGERLV